MDLENLIVDMQDDLIKDLQGLLRINSVQGKSEAGKPFGVGVDDSLKYMLDLGAKMGFKVKNCEGYCGWIEYGEGTELVGVLAHIDVVPEGDNWTSPPFAAEIRDGKIYARGTIDDKGPAMMALYALYALKKSGLPVSKRCRIILGGNEESGWECMDYYTANEEIPTCAITPDATYPVINVEKGILSIALHKTFSNEQCEIIRLLRIEGGNAVNMIPDYAEAELEIKDIEIREHLKEYFEKFTSETGYKMEIHSGAKEENIIIKSYGVSAHASLPEIGQNAIMQLILELSAVNFLDEIKNWLEKVAKTIGMEYYGESAGINFEDEVSGKLTLNVGVIKQDLKESKIDINIRYPISYTDKQVVDGLYKAFANEDNILWEEIRLIEPLYVSEDSPLIQTLLKVYKEVTGLPAYCIAIGGGTYARAMKNAVAFGSLFPGQEELAHQKDEYIGIDDLILNAKIYAKAIYELIK